MIRNRPLNKRQNCTTHDSHIQNAGCISRQRPKLGHSKTKDAREHDGVELAGLPRTTTYGFAATCRPVMPAARTMSAPRNSGNDAKDAAGRNKNAPTAMLSKPATMVF